MRKDDRSCINPFTGKAAYDTLDDDKFLNQCYREYSTVINKSELLDHTVAGQKLYRIFVSLVNSVEAYLSKINRSDYTDNYYDWEFHLIKDKTVNAFCMPGGKVVMFSGMLDVAEKEEDLAFILAHEISHALLDHSRTQLSKQQTKNSAVTLSYLGSLGLSLVGLGEVGGILRAATQVADIGSELFYLKPFGREQEMEADKLGINIVSLAGYDVGHIPTFWKNVSEQGVANNFDFFSTHPSDDKRIEALKQSVYEIKTNGVYYDKPIIGSGNFVNSIAANSTSTKLCSKCGGPVGEDDKFCMSCGQKIEETTVKCPNCNELIEKGNRFCIYCGYDLENNDENRLCCPKCNSLVEEDSKFCIYCGFDLSSTEIVEEEKELYCPNCSEEVSADDNFCSSCGYKI